MPHFIPTGFHTINISLAVRRCAEAVEFYTRVFGAVEKPGRLTMPGGLIGHTELSIGDTVLMLSDEFKEWNNLSPETLGGSPVKLAIYVDDVDALVERAVAAGAKLTVPVADQFYGDRSGRIEDPFGHTWMVATHVEDVAPEEMERRCAELYGEGK